MKISSDIKSAVYTTLARTSELINPILREVSSNVRFKKVIIRTGRYKGREAEVLNVSYTLNEFNQIETCVDVFILKVRGCEYKGQALKSNYYTEKRYNLREIGFK